MYIIILILFSLVAKQKENELAMWRRRATYDPMKAAAEGRRKQEEAKRTTQPKTSDRYALLRNSFSVAHF